MLSTQAALNLGNLHLRRGSFSAAAVAYEKALTFQDFKRRPITILNLGDVAIALGDEGQARDWWNRAASAGDPTVAEVARQRLGQLDDRSAAD